MRFLIGLIFPFCVFSQVLKQNLSNQGGSNLIGQYYISHTIGQPLAAGFFSNSKNSIIQGFEYKTSNNKLLKVPLAFSDTNIDIPIYFSKTLNNAIIIEGNKDIFPLDIYIYDLSGRLILTLKNQGYYQRKINLDHLNQAYYIVKVDSNTINFNGILIKKD